METSLILTRINAAANNIISSVPYKSVQNLNCTFYLDLDDIITTNESIWMQFKFKYSGLCQKHFGIKQWNNFVNISKSLWRTHSTYTVSSKMCVYSVFHCFHRSFVCAVSSIERPLQSNWIQSIARYQFLPMNATDGAQHGTKAKKKAYWDKHSLQLRSVCAFKPIWPLCTEDLTAAIFCCWWPTSSSKL